MNRGARKVSIFADTSDRRIFVGLLGRFATKYKIKILAWCLMPNHYHLEPDADGTSLCGMMRDLDGNYARSFNERHNTSGCLFQGPFKSMLLQDSEGLACVSRYIHLNPVDMGQDPRSYHWSSCSNYLGHVPAPPWMDIGPVMKAMGSLRRSGAESYAEYFEEGLRRPRRKKSDNPHSDFQFEWIRHLEEKCIERLLGKESLLGRIRIQSLVCYLAFRIHHIAADTIAAYFGYTSSEAVRVLCHRLQKRIESDPDFAEAVETANVSATQNR